MKQLYRLSKATLAACVLMFGASAAFAQVNEVAVKSNVSSTHYTPVPVLNDSQILWEQQREGTGGIVTGFFDGLGSGAYSADDFELDEPAQITQVTMLGFQNDTTLLDGILIDFTLYIFANDFGVPDGDPTDPESALLALTMAEGDPGFEVIQDPDQANLYTFVVNIPEALGTEFFLAQDRYWLVAAPNHDMFDAAGSTRWNWSQGEENLSPFYIIDPDDLFGGCCTNWTSSTQLGLDWSSLGLTFTIEGIPGEAEDPELGDFSLIAPPDGTELTVQQGTEDPVVVEWEVSENAEAYTWAINFAGEGFEAPLVELPSDGGGTQNQLTLTTGAIYDVMIGLGVEDGDTVELEWTVFASLGDESLQAEQVWGITVTVGDPTSTEPIETVKGFALEQNYPNPFNPTTNINFTIPEASDVKVEVFNMQGQRIATLANGMMSAGSHTVAFDATNLSSGIYLYRMTAGNFTATNKMMLVK